MGEDAAHALDRLLSNFNSKLSDEKRAEIDESSYTLQQIVTIASLIEKETDSTDRDKIASVIYNRLGAGMPLGIDAAILYLFPEHDGAPTREMLETDSPYNLRLYTGLPPTPICNPGKMSILAALNPERTNDYYYALDTATGEHRFFTNAQDFDAFVATQNYG